MARPASRSRSRSPRNKLDINNIGRTRSRSRQRLDDAESSSRHRHREHDHDASRNHDKKERNKDKKRKREKSAERRARKAEKRMKADEDARQVAELSVYSATDNPFHDANLAQQFRWHKKEEKDKKMGLSIAEAQNRDAIRRQEARMELERLNKQRAEREIEQQLREEEEARVRRLNESSQMADWIAKEGDFQLEQERKRAAIRLKEKRAKAIDFLAINLKYAKPLFVNEDDELDEAGLEIDLDEPYAIFENLSLEQTEELHDDISHYLSLETDNVNVEFWTNMMVVCKDRLGKLRTNMSRGRDATAFVENDVMAILIGKSLEELADLQRQVQTKLLSGQPLDVEYWENLLQSILVWKAKAKLKALHEVIVRNRLEQLRKRQRDEARQAQEELFAGVARSSSKNGGAVSHADLAPALEQPRFEINEDREAYDPLMSPRAQDLKELPYEERQLPIVGPQKNVHDLITLRRSVAASRFVTKAAAVVHEEAGIVDSTGGVDLASEALWKAEAERELDEEEEVFNLEETIQNPPTYNWEDKYRPRKPRYFNRVHTGYEWNKYNQTHYDTDNPPPKVVQGYKFNIFYPDLIDKSKAPTYKIVKESGNEETVLLLFMAGPPYEDIAFRIVNRSWEYSHKRGFRSSFDRGCLSLWFNFRRNFYRK